jgi:predicted nuclease of predicted toxin-antitoxin system
VRFLIDECLSVQLVAVAGEAGHEAHHVAHVGKAGWKDWNVVHYAREQDFVLVTNNAADFRKLYAAQPLHAGLVILIPNVDGGLQQQLFKGVPLMSSLSMANPLTRRSRSISTATRRHLHSMSYPRLNDGVGCPRVPSVRHEPQVTTGALPPDLAESNRPFSSSISSADDKNSQDNSWGFHSSCGDIRRACPRGQRHEGAAAVLRNGASVSSLTTIEPAWNWMSQSVTDQQWRL